MPLAVTNSIKFKRSSNAAWEKLMLQANINFNLIYPVGSIYMSTVNVDPGTLFGGTWEQLEDRFLLGAGSSYTAGGTGGSATMAHTHATSNHTLTVAEMPSHTHDVQGWRYNNQSSGDKWSTSYTKLSSDSPSSATPVLATGGGGAHNHGDTGAASNSDNMPPYLVVYMWKRLTLEPTMFLPPDGVLLGDVASEDIVPVAMGGTGADNAADALVNLGVDYAIVAREVLLWTNPSPGSYATGTVSIDLSSYRRVRIDFCPWGQTTLIESQEFYIGTSNAAIQGCLSYTSFNTDNASSAATFLNGVYRKFDVYSGGIVFQNGQMIYVGNVYQNWDSRAVPYRIWGVK